MKHEKHKKSRIYPNLRKTIPYFKKHYVMFILMLIVSAFTSTVSLLYPILSAEVVTGITIFNADSVIKNSIYLLILSVVLGVFYYLSSIIFAKASKLVYNDIQKDVLNSLTNISIKTYDNSNSGTFNSRINSDSSKLSSFLNSLIDSVTYIISNLSFLFYIMSLSFYIGITFFALLAIIYILENFRIRYRYNFDKQYKIKADNYSGAQYEVLKGIRDIKATNLKEKLLFRLDQSRDKLYKESLNFTYKYNLIHRLLSLMQNFVTVAILLLGVFLVLNGSLESGILLIIYMYIGRSFQVVNNIIGLKDRFKETELSAERLFELNDNNSFEQDKYGNLNLENVNGKITFENLSFSYKPETPLFENLSFTIEPNQTVAIVGKSGQGKTTILSLIARLYEPQGGHIKLDDYNINELTEESLRKNISYVMQSPSFFNMSLKDNLLLANNNATQEEIEDACKKAEIHSYIASLPDGYESVIGENGVKFSGGQRQRLSIARALIKKSKIIMLDEATSSLDNESQEKIKETIRNLSKDHTVIIVAHRLSTVLDAHKILVLDKRQIIAQGTHAELMKTCSTYANLYKNEIV